MRNPYSPHSARFALLARHVLCLDIDGDSADEDALATATMLTGRLAVTADHVVAHAASIRAYATSYVREKPYLKYGRRGTVADVIWRDVAHDVAVVCLRRELSGATPPRFDRRPTLKIGQAVIRIGYDSFYRAVAGYVHDFVKLQDDSVLFAASLPTDEGASGGPLFSFHDGRLVGVVTHATHGNESFPTAAYGQPLATVLDLIRNKDRRLHAAIMANASG